MLAQATIQEIFRQAWTHERRMSESVTSLVQKPPKINEIALRLSTEYLRLLTIELIHRSNRIAQLEEQEHSRATSSKARHEPSLLQPARSHDDHHPLDRQLEEDDERVDKDEDDPSSSHVSGLIEVRHLKKVTPGVLLDF